MSSSKKKEKWSNKQRLSLMLVFLLLFSMCPLYPSKVYATGAEPIAVMVENNGFSVSNVGGDSDSKLLWKKGSTTINSNALDLTNTSSQAGSVVKRNQVKLTDGFSTYFQMYFSNTADGIAFVLYKADTPKLGDIGGALGYGWKNYGFHGTDTTIINSVNNSIRDSIIVEFDTWKNYAINADQYDPNDSGYDSHVAIMLDGNQVHSEQSDSGAAVVKNADLSGRTVNAWVDYQSKDATHSTGIVKVTFGTGATKTAPENQSMTRTIQTSDHTPIAGDNVFVGFTSSTGGHTTTHKLLKWYFKDSYVEGGLDATPGTYIQAPGTISLTPDLSGINPSKATVVIKDEAGSALPNEAGELFLDDTSMGSFNTGAGASFDYNIPNSILNGSHTLRAVAQGGVTNFTTFTVDKHTVTYHGNGNNSGTVPSTSTYNDGANVTVSSNSGMLAKTGYEFAGWNTAADGSGTAYAASTGQISGIASDVSLYAVWSKFATSSGDSTFSTVTATPIVVDSGLVIDGFTGMIPGAKVMIQNVKSGDVLGFTNAGGISGTYEAATGVLTLSGAATPAQYQSALRSVKFSTTSSDTTARSVLFSIGGGLYNSANGHFYEYVSAQDISWSSAKTAAEGRSLYGRQGYLVTLTSSSENTFVTDKVTALGWIGAKDIHFVDASSDDSLGDWRWVTGPEGLADSGNGTRFYTGYATTGGSTVTYSNWWNGEPNNGDNKEYVAHIFGPLSTMPSWAKGPTNPASPGQWNDFEINRSDGAVKGYVVEYGGMPTDTPINVQGIKTVNIDTSIAKSNQTITFNSFAPATYGDSPITLSATASSGLAVSYTSTNTSVAQISGNVLTIVGVGSADIHSSQAGDSNYFATGDVIQTLTVNPKTLTVGGTFTAKNKSYDGNTSAVIDQNNLVLLGIATGDVVNLTPILKFYDAGIANGKTVSLDSASTLDNMKYILSLTGAPTTTANITGSTGGGSGSSDKDRTPVPTTPTNTGGSSGGTSSGGTTSGGTTGGGTATGGGTTTGGSNTGTGTGDAKPSASRGFFDVIVGGVKQEPAGQLVVGQDNAGKSVATVEVQTDKINEILAKLSGSTPDAESVNKITVPAGGSHNTVISELNGQMIKDMETKAVTLEVKTEKAIYVLPAKEIDIKAVSETLGKNVTLSDIKVAIEIKTPVDDKVKVTVDALDANHYTLVVPSVEFNITCKLGDKTVSVEKFNSYLERLIPVPDGVDASKITTAVVTDGNGKLRQVPTKLTTVDGKTYAEVNTLTNSVYTVIWNPITFTDTQNVWAGKDMDNIASRIIMPGVSKDQFDPNGTMTKSDFIATMVKALGLKESKYKGTYKDVSIKDKNAGYIATAYEYGLIGKAKDGKLHGNSLIVRKDMFQIIINGMKVTKLKAKASASEKESILSMYLDADKTTAATKAMVVTLNKANIMNYNTFSKIRENEAAKRSEVAHYVIWLLKSSALID